MSGFGSITAGDNIVLTSVSASTNVTIGGGTPVTKMKIYNVTISGWNSISAGTTSAQTGTISTGSFSGLSSSDILFVNGTTAANWSSTTCILFNVSASTNQAWFLWRNVSASAQTPPTGSYKIFAITT